MTDEELAAELTELQDILIEFAQEQHRANENYSFLFLPINKSETLEDTYEDFLKDIEITGLYISLTPLSEENMGVLDLSECLCEWLFGTTRLASYRQRTDEILERMIFLSQATKLWEVKCQPVEWYENKWNDFLFESENQVFILHLGVVD